MIERKHTPLADTTYSPTMPGELLNVPYVGKNHQAAATEAPLPGDHEARQQRREAEAYARLLFGQAAELPPIKILPGPLMPVISEAMGEVSRIWTARHAQLEPHEISELSKHPNYFDSNLVQLIKNKHGITEDEIQELRPKRASILAGHFSTYGDSLGAQIISRGLLDTPPYLSQSTSAGCVRTCFKMIFSAIAEDRIAPPTEDAITSCGEYGGYSFDEDILFNALSTEYFAKATGKIVLNRLYIGADYALVAKKATQIKNKRPDAQVFAMTTQRSYTVDIQDRLHACVLLEAATNTITAHNPAPRKHRLTCKPSEPEQCGSTEYTSKYDFSERWAAGLHRVNIVVALPS